MKRVLVAFLMFCLFAPAVADDVAPAGDVAVFVPSQIVTDAIAQYVPADGRAAAATTYVSVMNPDDGTMTPAAFAAVCTSGTFDMATDGGIAMCDEFVEYMLAQTKSCQESGGEKCTETFDLSQLDTFCPPSGNSLRSITGETRTDDICSSSNIYMGSVFKHKGRNSCGCLALACNSGYEFKNGRCVAVVADARGFCLRNAHPKGPENSNMESCRNFCTARAAAQGCKHSNTVMSHSTGQCICNADAVEVNLAMDSMRAAAELRRKSVKYYNVCHADQGRTGGQEYCVDDIFNWTSVQQAAAQELAIQYARVRNGHEIVCSDNFYSSGNDDFFACADLDNKNFYQFKFDSLKSSFGLKARGDIFSALCTIYGGTVAGHGSVCTADQDKCSQIANAGKKFAFDDIEWGTWGMKVYENVDGKFACYRKPNGNCLETEDGSLNLATIAGVNSCQFYINAAIQVRTDADFKRRLEQYVKAQTGAKDFTCDASTTPVMASNAAKYCQVSNRLNGFTDDVWRCYADGQPVDFVVDDLSEWNDERIAGGLQAADCVTAGGTFTGEQCMHLSQEQCNKIGQATRTQWDATTKQCLLLDANFVDNLNFGTKISSIAGMAVVGAVLTLLPEPTSKGAAVLVWTEITGSIIELTGEVMAGTAANEFFDLSRDCDDATCAERLIREYYQRMANLSDDISPAEVSGIDTEFARLFTVLGADHPLVVKLAENGSVENANGGLSSWEPEEVMRAIGMALQLTSVAVSVGNWLFKGFNKTAGVISDLTKLRRGARVADAVDSAIDVLNNASDAARMMANVKAADRVNDAFQVTNSVFHGKGVIVSIDDLSALEQAAVKTMLDDLADAGVTVKRQANGFLVKGNKNSSRLIDIRDRIVDVSRTATSAYKTAVDESVEQLSKIADDMRLDVQDVSRGRYRIGQAQTLDQAQEYLDNARHAARNVELGVEEFGARADILRADYAVDDIGNVSQQVTEYSASAQKELQAAENAFNAKKLELENAAQAAQYEAQHRARQLDIEAAISHAEARHLNTSEHITEPVTYFRSIGLGGNSPEEAVKILNDAGIRASTDPSDVGAWIINEANMGSSAGTGRYELVSPFLSPESAAQQFDAVSDLLAKNGIPTHGAVTPTKISQIDPTVATGVSRPQAQANIRTYFESNPELAAQMNVSASSSDDELLDALIYKKAENAVKIDGVRESYSGQDVIYRGQMFATSDASSAYANMAPKSGVTGNVLGTKNAGYANNYSGAADVTAGLSGSSIKGKTLGDQKVGFLNVYQDSAKNLYMPDESMERLADTRLSDLVTEPIKRAGVGPETLLTPQNNPLIDRYINVNGNLYKIDETDPEWGLILDSFAPDLSKTYNPQMLERIENVKSGMVDGVVQTYDIDPGVMQNLSAGQ